MSDHVGGGAYTHTGALHIRVVMYQHWQAQGMFVLVALFVYCTKAFRKCLMLLPVTSLPIVCCVSIGVTVSTHAVSAHSTNNSDVMAQTVATDVT